MRNVYQSAVVSYQELKDNKISYDGAVRIIYHTKDAYKRTAKLLGLMDDFKVGCYVSDESVVKNINLLEWSTTNRLQRNSNISLQRQNCLFSSQYELEGI